MARQPTYRQLFSVGDLVEIAQAPLDGESNPQWLRGRVTKITTRLHVQFSGISYEMAYERADYNRGTVRKCKPRPRLCPVCRDSACETSSEQCGK